MAIELADDEVVLRKYKISQIDFRSLTFKPLKKAPRRKKSNRYDATGIVYVTNRRLIYNVDNTDVARIKKKSKDSYSQQVKIEDIHGIDFLSSTVKGSLIPPIIVILLGLFTISLGIGLVLLLIGAIWAYIRNRNVESYMMFGIKSPSSDYSMYISEMSRGYMDTMSWWCTPTEEFQQMANEIGAIILNIQKYGDAIITDYIDE